MRRKQEAIEKIERYLRKDLSKEERDDFVQQIETNIDLQREVELHRSLHTEMGDIDSLEFRKKLLRIGDDLRKKRKKKVYFSFKVAAVVLFIFGISLYFFFQTVNDKNNLFDEYYAPYPVEDVIRGNDREMALKLYANGEYAKAILQLKELISENTEYSVFDLYLGNSFLNTNQEKKATEIFKKIPKTSQYYENAQWYLALSYLKMNDLKKTVGTLENVIGYNGIHKTNAVVLKSRLKEIEKF